MVGCKSGYIVGRQQLQRMLQTIESTPLMVGVAAIGYGKTTAVACLRESHPEIPMVYVPFTHETDSAEYVWKRIVGATDESLASLFQDIPFPNSLEEREKLAEELIRKLKDNSLTLVLDDYHNVHCPAFDTLITFLAQYPGTGLHILLLSRRSPRLPVDELVLRGCCTVLSSELFQFNREEMHQYAARQEVLLTFEQEQRLLTLSEGWVTAIQLLLDVYKRTGEFGPSGVVNHLIETSEITRYTPRQIWLLKQLSHLEEFSASLASVVTGLTISPYMIEQLAHASSFMKMDIQRGMYHLHPLFRAYLIRAYEADRHQWEDVADGLSQMIDEKTLYLRAGRYHLARQNPVRGFGYLLRAEAYDTIMEEFAKASRNRLLDAEPSFIVSLFSAIPIEVRRRHLYPWLAYIGFYTTNIDGRMAESLIAELREALESVQDGLPEETVQSIEGEIALIRAYGVFNDAKRMAQYFHDAYRLLGGKSRIADKEKIITFGSPHALYLYHRKKGTLEETMKAVQGMLPFYSEMAGGCGKGFDDLLLAEFSLERGDVQRAQLFAYRSFYRASSLDQWDVMLSSQFTLARIQVFEGRMQEAIEMLRLQKDKIASLESPILQASYDLCVAYLASQLGRPEDIASWIKNGEIEHTPVLYQGEGFVYLVYGKYLLMQKKYIQLEVHCERMKEVLSRFSNQIGYLHAYILESAAKYQLYGLQSAEIPLIRALEIGFADDLMVPFAEYSSDSMDILMEVKKRYRSGILLPHSAQAIAFSAYLDKVLSLVLDYFATMKDLYDDRDVLDTLSKREMEILKLLTLGKTNQMIAKDLFVAEVTVRKHLTTLYKKLDVRKRAEAVRRALELGIS
ncbi:MAG: LuxR C-terminal-related transcriptional regulator [Sphaerochaeta sp.]